MWVITNLIVGNDWNSKWQASYNFVFIINSCGFTTLVFKPYTFSETLY